MTLADIHSKPLEEILTSSKISLWCHFSRKDGYDHLGMPIFKHEDQWWEATTLHPKAMGEGPTPREAILDWFRKVEGVK